MVYRNVISEQGVLGLGADPPLVLTFLEGVSLVPVCLPPPPPSRGQKALLRIHKNYPLHMEQQHHTL